MHFQWENLSSTACWTTLHIHSHRLVPRLVLLCEAAPQERYMNNFQAELLIINANYSEGKSKTAFGSKTTAIKTFACKPQSDFWSTQLTSLSRFLSCPLIIKVILGTFPEIIGFANSELQFYQMTGVSFWQNGSMISWTKATTQMLLKCSTKQTHRRAETSKKQKKSFRTQGTKDGPKKVILKQSGLTNLENK